MKVQKNINARKKNEAFINSIEITILNDNKTMHAVKPVDI